MLAELLAAERGIWDALVAGDAEADRAALHSDFLGLYPDGYADRDDHVGQLAQGPTIASYAIESPRASAPGDGLGLLSYRARFTRPGRPEEAMWVTSLWRRTPDGWLNLFSQDTPAA
ncbi:nuclear transport factor 2 family protein [Jannaschia seohaensis]|uniref:nuclear transport factor 2 family protein n=1 Tax=Jannaschia seohaensis TaxID=475081 RepID=UPI001FE8FD37|nr:nuclear transport factor 2 family protein [Jannaschia seohaensis]